MRFGTFIHFNSGTVQFCKGDIEDWEYGVENDGHKRLCPFDRELRRQLNCRASKDGLRHSMWCVHNTIAP